MPLVSTIALFLLKRTRLGEEGAKALAWIITIIGIVLIALAGWQIVKAIAVDDYKTEQRAKSAEQALERTNKADAADADLEARDDAATEELEEGARNAASSDPAGAGKPVGPVTRSVVDSLRDQRFTPARN